jgi:hypothetical protein
MTFVDLLVTGLLQVIVLPDVWSAQREVARKAVGHHELGGC